MVILFGSKRWWTFFETRRGTVLADRQAFMWKKMKCVWQHMDNPSTGYATLGGVSYLCAAPSSSCVRLYICCCHIWHTRTHVVSCCVMMCHDVSCCERTNLAAFNHLVSLQAAAQFTLTPAYSHVHMHGMRLEYRYSLIPKHVSEWGRGVWERDTTSSWLCKCSVNTHSRRKKRWLSQTAMATKIH